MPRILGFRIAPACGFASFLIVKALFCLFVLASGFAQARVWTDSQGRTLEAEIVRADDVAVVVSRGGKEVKLPLDKLSDEDRKFVDEWLKDRASGKTDKSGDDADKAPDEKPAAGGDGKTLEFDGKPLETGGKMNTYEYPYDAETQERVTKKLKGKDTGYKIAIAVPADFDPSKPQRVFIANTAVNNDDQARSGNFGVFGMYAPACVANGWICLAYDTSIGRANHNTDILCAFAKLKSVWPGITGWDFAVGGFSGGAKGCFYPCGYLVKNDYRVTGAFLGGCNADFSAKGKELYNAPSGGYRKIKVFMSTGKTDDLVSEGSVKGVLASLKANGMRITRSEFFDGGHSFHKPHFEDALKWFAEPAGK